MIKPNKWYPLPEAALQSNLAVLSDYLAELPASSASEPRFLTLKATRAGVVVFSLRGPRYTVRIVMRDGYHLPPLAAEVLRAEGKRRMPPSRA
jgi:hypothetical protein